MGFSADCAERIVHRLLELDECLLGRKVVGLTVHYERCHRTPDGFILRRRVGGLSLGGLVARRDDTGGVQLLGSPCTPSFVRDESVGCAGAPRALASQSALAFHNAPVREWRRQ